MTFMQSSLAHLESARAKDKWDPPSLFTDVRAAVMEMARAHIRAWERGQGVVKTLIFDCDGVLSDTERYGHLVAFNQTSASLSACPLERRGLQSEVRIAGGKERMMSLLTPEFVAAAGLPSMSGPGEAVRAGTSARPRSIQLVVEGHLPARPASLAPSPPPGADGRSPWLDLGRAVRAGHPDHVAGRRRRRVSRSCWPGT